MIKSGTLGQADNTAALVGAKTEWNPAFSFPLL